MIFAALITTATVACSQQQDKADANGVCTSVQKPNTRTSETSYVYKDKDGKSYPVYRSKNGKYFVIMTSKKNGKRYNKYIVVTK